MKNSFYIDYPQISDSKTHEHWCASCKISTTVINGLLENHEPHCTYRLQKEVALHKEMLESDHTRLAIGSVDLSD